MTTGWNQGSRIQLPLRPCCHIMSCPTQDHQGRGSVLLSFAMTDADQVFQHSHGTAPVTPSHSSDLQLEQRRRTVSHRIYCVLLPVCNCNLEYDCMYEFLQQIESMIPAALWRCLVPSWTVQPSLHGFFSPLVSIMLVPGVSRCIPISSSHQRVSWNGAGLSLKEACSLRSAGSILMNNTQDEMKVGNNLSIACRQQTATDIKVNRCREFYSKLIHKTGKWNNDGDWKV